MSGAIPAFDGLDRLARKVIELDARSSVGRGMAGGPGGLLRRVYFCKQKDKGATMKRALITIATVGILAPTAWVAAANAQQRSPGPAPSQAYARSQMAPTQAYAQRRVRRSARRAPAAAAPAGTAYAAAPAGTARRAPAAGQAYAQGHYVWPASPGPKKRGNMCVKDVDALRGYGFMEPCKK
jgi:hypothetical protein